MELLLLVLGLAAFMRFLLKPPEKSRRTHQIVDIADDLFSIDPTDFDT